MGETPIAGTATGAQIKFTFDYAGPSGPISITATATVSGDEIKGEMDYGLGVAPFTRQARQVLILRSVRPRRSSHRVVEEPQVLWLASHIPAHQRRAIIRVPHIGVPSVRNLHRRAAEVS